MKNITFTDDEPDYSKENYPLLQQNIHYKARFHKFHRKFHTLDHRILATNQYFVTETSNKTHDLIDEFSYAEVHLTI